MPCIRRLVLALSLSLALPALADEGMWMANQLPELAPQLRAAGFSGDPAALADLTAAPLNAVVKSGGGTGAFVSGQGLLITNHHVAYGVIQYNSKPERNLLEQGFVADSQAQELRGSPDFRVLVTERFDAVTERVLKAAAGKKGLDYFDAIDAASKAIVAECEALRGRRCSVASMDYGSAFYRIQQLELRDVRLVYAPPGAIGKYGDEIDNFMWPRHSGDFTLLRAYVGADGQPADYDPANKPYAAPAHLQIARDGPRTGDFAMLAGYPGITYRHRLAQEFAERIGWGLGASVDALDALIAIVEREGGKDADAAVKYASQLASLKNSSKRFSGERSGLLRSDAQRKRADNEAAMLQWLQQEGKNPDCAKGQDCLSSAETLRRIEQVQALLNAASATRERDLVLGLIQSQTQLLRASITLQRLALERGKPDARREAGYQRRDENLIEAQLRQVQRRYASGMEQALLLELLRRYRALPPAQHVAAFDTAFGSDEASAKAALERLYGATRLGDENFRLEQLKAEPAAVRASDDALLALAATLQPALLRLEQERKQREGELMRLRPAYMSALKRWYRSQQRPLFPDANATLRVSYGRVAGFSPRDGVVYEPVTTVAGIVEKHTGKEPFNAPEPLLAAIARGDFGDTRDPALNTQTVNFLTNLDTTGGNSGSPVLNARGELIGLNFDSNWESVSASWWFDPRYKRAVHVDMRYMRWLMEKVYPAPVLLGEMGLGPAR
ncbi:peptidase S46-like protein [Tahibacter aquaticus]|uniref:Dipeptidyl-peptidase n=1 Tax=Tahibacter aquaticus TaxID=520092 RepID=A0A4R6Z730_9GAMM|nr:S46 family peptidase [Tahibacter aquaticus]TDR47562.1 peptidase S46-like protein [Tahibacter aquaticus]